MAVHVVLFFWAVLSVFWNIGSCEEIGLFLENCLGVTFGRVFEDWFRQEAPEKVVLKSVFLCGNVTSAMVNAQMSTVENSEGNKTLFLVTPSMAAMLESIYATFTLRSIAKPTINIGTMNSARIQSLREKPFGLFPLKNKANENARAEGIAVNGSNPSNGSAVLLQLFRLLEQNVSVDSLGLDSKVMIYVYDIESKVSLSSSVGSVLHETPESTCTSSVSNDCVKGHDSLSKTSYTIAVVERAPYVMFDLDDNGKVINPNGLVVHLIDSLASRLGFSYSLVPKDKHGKLLPNGSWTGAVGALIKNEVDMIAGDFSITPNRSAVLDFTTPFMHSTEALVIRRTMINPTVRDLLRTHLRPFHWSIWVTMGVFWVVSTTLLAFTSDPVTNRPFLKVLEGRNMRMDDTPTKERNTWVSILFQLLGILCQQGCSLSPIRTSGRMILFTVCLMALVCYNFYTSVFISFTTVSRKSVPINTLADVLRDESFQVGFMQGDMAEDMFMYSEVPAYRKVWARLQRSDRTYVKDTEEGMLRVYSEKFAFIADTHALEWYAHHNCSFKMLQDRVLSEGYHFILPRNSPDTEVFSKYLKLFTESGLVTRLLAGVMPPTTPDFCEADNSHEAVGLDRMAGLFLCLTIGFGVAIISLWLERVGVDDRGSNKIVTITMKTQSKF